MPSTPPLSAIDGSDGVGDVPGVLLRHEGVLNGLTAPLSACGSVGTPTSSSKSTQPVDAGFRPPMSFLRRMTPPISASARQIRTKAAVDPSERDIRKELERKELVAMILESIANVPVAVERIHTNEKLREALREEMGAENVLLHRFFDRDATMKQEEQEQQNELVLHESLSADNLRMWDHNRHGDDNSDSDSDNDSDVPRPATSMGIYGDYDHSVDGGSKMSDGQEDSDGNEESEESSGFGSEYENDLAEAVNQLCMTDETLTAMEKMISDPIGIANATFEDVSSARISSSPQSSFGLGASPGNTSLDGEPVSALWPRQPNQFAFTQEEDGTVRGEDEVYSEMVSSVCEDETFHDNDDENEEEEEEEEEEGDNDGSGEEELDDDTEEKVFVMEEEDDGGVDDEMMSFRSGASNAFLKSPPLKIEATTFQDDAADKRESKATNVHTVDIKGGDDKSDEERQDEESDDDDDDDDQKEYEVFQLRIIRQKNRTGFEPNEEWCPRTGSLVGGRYKVEMAIGEAVFSRTYKCIDTNTNQSVCLKIIKNNKEYFDQGVDEIRVLEYVDRNCKVDERHLVRLLDYFYFREHLIIVTELLRDNLYEFSRLLLERGVINYFSIPRLKKIAVEVLEALDTLHSMGLVHCDLKPENILIRNFSACTIKVIDFGSACFTTDELTSYVQSRSYRAPEVILGLVYDEKIDLWSLGCIMAEMFTGEVLFRNDSEQTLLARILATIGPIPAPLLDGREDLQTQLADTGLFKVDHMGNGVLAAALIAPSLGDAVPTGDQQFLAFLHALLQIDPARRLSAREALTHPWLQHGVFSENRI